MKIRYSTEPCVYMECAALLTKLFYTRRHPDDSEVIYDVEDYFADIAQHYHVDKEQFSRFIGPLSALYRDMEQAADGVSQEMAELFFTAESEELASLGITLSLVLEKNRPRDAQDEKQRARLRFCIGLMVLHDVMPADIDSASDFDEESFIRLLEKSSDTPAARWTALMVWRNTDKYLDLLEETLRVPAEIYRRHIPELQPLFDEEIALTRALLAEDPVRVLREHFFVSLDSDELTLRPQAAVISGAGIWIYDDIFDAEHLMLIGCCFEQVHALAFGSENHLVRLVAQLKAIDDKQRLKIMAALREKPLCGQEICTLTGLSAATVSHHMNALINGSFVTLEKVGTRINYRRAPEKIESFLSQLGRFLSD